MTLLFIFGAAVFTIFALYMTARHFLTGQRRSVALAYLDEEFLEIEELAARKAVLVNSLRELEFEHETGQLPEDEWERYRTKYEKQAVDIMRRLDEIHGGRGWEHKIDDELKRRLGDEPAPDDGPSGDREEREAR